MFSPALWCTEQETCTEVERCDKCPLNWTDKRRKWWLSLSKTEAEIRTLLAYWQWGKKANKAMLNSGYNENTRDEILDKIRQNKIMIMALKHELYRKQTRRLEKL